MNSVAFLAAFLVLSLLGAAVLWLRDRVPRSMESRMREFEKELEALAPAPPQDGRRRSRASSERRARGPGAG